MRQHLYIGTLSVACFADSLALSSPPPASGQGELVRPLTWRGSGRYTPGGGAGGAVMAVDRAKKKPLPVRIIQDYE